MMNIYKITIIIIVLTQMLSGCASITRGITDTIVIDSKPQGASVTMTNGASCGVTPCAVEVFRRSDFVVEFHKDGCKTAFAKVSNKAATSGIWLSMVGNALFFLLVPGIMIDLATGSLRDVTPNPVQVELNCE